VDKFVDKVPAAAIDAASKRIAQKSGRKNLNISII
jgi:hypothetical protein